MTQLCSTGKCNKGAATRDKEYVSEASCCRDEPDHGASGCLRYMRSILLKLGTIP